MKKAHFLLLFLILGLMSNAFAQKNKIALVIHGGAGTILKKNMTPAKEKAYQEKLNEALEAGYAVLDAGGTALEAVSTSIQLLEDSPLFNAGKGAVFTSESTNELDASIMDGKTLNAGAVAGIKTIKNPILAAQAVMLHSPHVMMSGRGADAFAQEQGLETVDSSYFFTKNRFEQLQRIREKEKTEGKTGSIQVLSEDHKFGTVGAVALDRRGNIAAGTSTGGMSNKKYGRIGDSPIIGAGTYANNKTCGVSSTGHGEYFIRGLVAYDIAALMEYKKLSLEEAAKQVVMKKLKKLGGSGGIIALDKNGNISMTFNTKGMYRAYKKADGTKKIAIYKQ